MKFVFFRHMPTANNLANVFLGRLDLDCDADFISAHEDEIKLLEKKYNFSDIYCSPLKRAIQSVKLYFPDKSFVIDDRLIERDLGEWSNISKSKVRKLYPDAFYKTGNLKFSFTPAGGESFENLMQRTASFIFDVYTTHNSNDDIGVITHNGVLTALKCILSQSTSTENIKFQEYLVPFFAEIDVNNIDIIKKYL